MDIEGNDLGCACVHPDPSECARLRYGKIDRFDWNEIDDACECICHGSDEESNWWDN